MNEETIKSIINYNERATKEIERLKEEIQRLTNIIDELEKWLKEKQDLTCGCGITREYIYAFEDTFEYLQDLKEGK